LYTTYAIFALSFKGKLYITTTNGKPVKCATRKITKLKNKQTNKNPKMDAWVALSVKRATLDFSSGHDLRVLRSSPKSGSVLGMEPA